MFYEPEGWGWHGLAEEGLWWETRGYHNGHISPLQCQAFSSLVSQPICVDMIRFTINSTPWKKYTLIHNFPWFAYFIQLYKSICTMHVGLYIYLCVGYLPRGWCCRCCTGRSRDVRLEVKPLKPWLVSLQGSWSLRMGWKPHLGERERDNRKSFLELGLWLFYEIWRLVYIEKFRHSETMEV